MTVFFFHVKDMKVTLNCHYCHGPFGLLFACSECSIPVCVYCGLLEQPGKPYLVSIMPDMDAPPDPDDPSKIGIEGWLDTDDLRERFLCPACFSTSNLSKTQGE